MKKSEIEEQLLFSREVIALSVIRRYAVQPYALAVLLRGVALVALPVVERIFVGKAVHVVVAEGLGQDAGRRYGLILAVALHDGGVGQVAVGREAVAVDDDRLGTCGQLVESAVHGEEAGVEDVYLVDLLGCDHAHRPRHGVAYDLIAQSVASFLRELLRVVEQLVVVAGRQNDRRRINAARQASASCLIASCLYLSFKIMWFKHIFLFYGLQSFYDLQCFL